MECQSASDFDNLFKKDLLVSDNRVWGLVLQSIRPEFLINRLYAIPKDPLILLCNLRPEILSLILPLMPRDEKFRLTINNLLTRAVDRDDRKSAQILVNYGARLSSKSKISEVMLISDSPELISALNYPIGQYLLNKVIELNLKNLITSVSEKVPIKHENLKYINSIETLKFIFGNVDLINLIKEHNSMIGFLRPELKTELIEMAIQKKNLEIMIRLIISEHVTWPNRLYQAVLNWPEGKAWFENNRLFTHGFNEPKLRWEGAEQ